MTIKDFFTTLMFAVWSSFLLLVICIMFSCSYQAIAYILKELLWRMRNSIPKNPYDPPLALPAISVGEVIAHTSNLNQPNTKEAK